MTPVERVTAVGRASLARHFLALSPGDRALRFGAPVGAAFVADYVWGVDFRRDAMLGVRGAAGDLVAVVHVAPGERGAEIGVSVLAPHRGTGLATRVVTAAAAHARACGAQWLVARNLEGNAPMLALARRVGMAISRDDGEIAASLALARGRCRSGLLPAWLPGTCASWQRRCAARQGTRRDQDAALMGRGASIRCVVVY